jgi:hypothetical protein
MCESLAADLRNWLIEPDFSAEQRDPLSFDAAQRTLVESRTASGYRRVRGPAGAGKSQVIAARAAKLAAEEKEILVVTYNITLLHYLRDLCARVPGARPNRITWLNFHNFCKRLAKTIMPEEYDVIWHDHFGEHADAFLEVPRALLRRVENGIELPDRYDAIFVDEGQDFRPEWWSLLRKACRQGGEMILVADATQDVYGTASRWTDQAMIGAGFSGTWAELPTSHRLPAPLADVARTFAEEFLPEQQRILPVSDQGELPGLFPCQLRWVQTRQNHSVEACVREMLRLIRQDDKGDRSMADLTILTDNNPDGLEIVKKLIVEFKIKTVDTFDGNAGRGGESRRKKLAFRKGDARVKVTTLHSFKGWESRLLVIHIARAKSVRDLSVIYTGLTRLKTHASGSFLTVVCSEARLARFGQTWPDFEVR